MDVHELFSQDRIILFDGGMGTMLQARGLIAECPETLNEDHPDVIADIERMYKEAGSQAVETNSLGLNTIKLAKQNKKDMARSLAKSAVNASRLGVGNDFPVFFSLGPTGEFASPYGKQTLKSLYESYIPAVEAAAEAGASAFVIETQCDLTETRAAILAVKEHSSLPFMISFTFEKNGRTLMGNTPQACAVTGERLGATAMGINCSGGPEELLPVVKAMRTATKLPLIVQPNAGLPQVINGVTSFPFSAEDMAAKMPAILDAGADGIGGCCGTTPAHISAMDRLLEGRTRKTIPQSTPALVSRRAGVPLEEALENYAEIVLSSGDTLNDTMDDWMDDVSEASACLLNVCALVPDEITYLVEEEQDLPRKPLMFRVKTKEQGIAALRAYSGVAAVLGEIPEDILSFYGAYSIGE